MSPYLTIRGRWLLLSGVLFILLGALFSSSLILFLGEIQIAVLAVAFMLLVPGALALDRRQIVLEIDTPEDSAAITAIVDEPLAIKVHVKNQSGVGLHALLLNPFNATAPIQVEEVKARRLLPSRHALVSSIAMRISRTGRWVLQGFDVRISDPLGLIETRDYLPCIQAFECYPRAIALGTRRVTSGRVMPRREAGRHAVEQLGMGTDVRDLREFLPGDPLRHIAWKATVRRGKLISKNFEHETSQSVYVLLDISCSMRGGQHPGQKLEHSIGLAVAMATALLKKRDAVGLMTFDEKLYGHIPSGTSPRHVRRILHHLVGLNTVVDPDLTELDEDEVEALIADYLLIQERLDFRKGDDLEPGSGVNRQLLQRWLMTQSADESLQSATLTEGIFERRASRQRRFAQSRGIPIPYRVEARLGMKERGLVDALEKIVATSKGRHQIVVISDLCGIMNLDLLSRGVKLSAIKGNRLKFLVPFTPSFYEDYDEQMTDRYRVIKELFTSAERDERMLAVDRLRSLGVEVEFITP